MDPNPLIKSVGLISDYILSADCPFLGPTPPKSCTCRVSMMLLRLINRVKGVQSLICPLRGAITVHCEEPHAFEDNI